MLHFLLSVGAPEQFVEWIKECITTPKFSIALNGTLVGYFDGRKGLRQGDSIPSYLFVLAMEAFYWLLKEMSTDMAATPTYHSSPPPLRMISQKIIKNTCHLREVVRSGMWGWLPIISLSIFLGVVPLSS
jgi:hypothetical protein